MIIPLSWYLILAAALFCIGLYAVLARRNVVTILMGVTLMLNAVTLNLVAFWRHGEPGSATGGAFGLFVYVVAAVEIAVGLALAIALWQGRGTAILDDVDSLKG